MEKARPNWVALFILPHHRNSARRINFMFLAMRFLFAYTDMGKVFIFQHFPV